MNCSNGSALMNKLAIRVTIGVAMFLVTTSAESIDCFEESQVTGVQWLTGRELDSRQRGRRFGPHQRHCVVSLSKDINPSLVLVQPRKTCPFITEILLMGHKRIKQTNQDVLFAA